MNENEKGMKKMPEVKVNPQTEIDKDLGKKFATALKAEGAEHVALQKEISVDGEESKKQSARVAAEIADTKKFESQSEKEALSARLKKYTEAGFDVLIQDLEDQLIGFKGWFQPKDEIREKIAYLQQMKATDLAKNFLPSWENIMIVTKFNRSRVKVALETLEDHILEPGDMEKFKAGMKVLEDQIKPTPVKLSGE